MKGFNNLKLGGKERRIIFDLNALCDLEEKYGDIYGVLDNLGKSPKMRDIRYLLFIGLKQDDESLTEKEVGQLITLKNMNEVVDSIGKALGDSMPDTDNAQNNEKNI